MRSLRVGAYLHRRAATLWGKQIKFPVESIIPGNDRQLQRIHHSQDAIVRLICFQIAWCVWGYFFMHDEIGKDWVFHVVADIQYSRKRLESNHDLLISFFLFFFLLFYALAVWFTPFVSNHLENTPQVATHSKFLLVWQSPGPGGRSNRKASYRSSSWLVSVNKHLQ